MSNTRCGVSDRPKCFYVYIVASANRVLYIGVTNDLVRRVWQHKTHRLGGFTSKYKVTRLVHWESFDHVQNAIAREKELKGWLRVKKVNLVEESNPKWKDLAERWHQKRSDAELRREFDKLNPTSGEKPIH